ncbi:MAG: mrdA [Fibrobacteres bacterium]|nr:mrdA [Fibrobacterota bacterium]
MQANPSTRLDDPFYRGAIGRNILIIFGCLVLGLCSRLFYLQIIKGSYHQKLSEQNSMRLQIVHAPRGLIYDRNGALVARNRPSYQVAILPTQLKDPKRVMANLMRFQDSAGVRIFDSTLVAWSLLRGKWKKFQPLVILEDASTQIVAMVEEHQLDLPGVVTVMDSRRSYPFGYSAGHVLGYMDEIKEEELEDSANYKEQTGDSLPYMKGDRIGRKGLEKTYEPIFRGRDGVRYIKVNAFGKEMEVIKEMPQIKPVPGSNLVTTIDMGLQVLADSLLGDTVKGAVVAIDPRNGEVLVMASSPRMDANIFSLSKERRSKEWAKLALDPSMPLNNRATVGGYEPGSTWKGVMNVAALQSGKVDPGERMARGCTGGYRFGNRVWHCWDPKGHGSMSMVDAFTESCDVYYYQVGLIIGMDIMNKVAKDFGFGDRTGIDLDEERSGMLVDSASYTRKFKRRGWTWTRGLVLNLSIGQGQIVTPLQLANYAAGLGNGKYLFRPHFIKEVRDRAGNVVQKYQPEVLHELNMTPEQQQVMLKAMEAVVNSPHGTGGRARMTDVIVGGKTGSAENPHGGKTHALFIGVAPLYQPELAIAVVLENVGHGGSLAAPIAGAIFREYFKRKVAGAKQVL